MFQLSVTKLFLLVLVAVSLLALWLLDTNRHQWDRVLPESDELVLEDVQVPESTKNDTFKTKEFVPNNEWQTIQQDQSIPPGLHVQMNLQTGVRNAKLIENNKNSITNDLAITHSNKSEDINEPKDVHDTLQHKFKSYSQIKNDLKELKMAVKSEMDLVDELSVKFQEKLKVHEENENDLKNILIDLEYLLHQVDTAEVFVKNKGIETIIIPCINSNSSFMKEQGALILGSAASNNQKVQIAALETNVIPLLLQHINADHKFSVQKNCFFALSSITRRFPAALKQVLDNNGIEVFMSVFKRPKSVLNTTLKLKVSQLLEDLIIELEDAKLTLKEETSEKIISEAKERVRQYDELHLKEKLVVNGWCEILGNEFIILSNSLTTNVEIHEMFEASGKSLLAMNKSCKTKLQGNKLLFESFYKLEAYYKNLFQQDNFFSKLYYLVNELTNTYNPIVE